ncbi:MAG: putative toxin-antitoxin system toxin component, PIN family [Pseudomonadota bacterium]
MRIVLDTNVFVSALIKPEGTTGIVLKTVLQIQQHTLLLSQDILEELESTLTYPKIKKCIVLNSDQIDLWVASLRMVAHEVNPRFDYPTLVPDDPKDDRYIIAAIEGKADCIVSGDKHLLNLNPYERIPILKPAEFLNDL